MNPIKFNFIWKIQALGWSYRVHLAGEKTNLQLTFNQKKLLRKHTRNLHSATTATSTTWSWWTAEPPVCFYKFNISRIPNTDNAAVTILYNDLFSVVHENEFSRNPSICVDVVKNCTISPSSVYRYIPRSITMLIFLNWNVESCVHRTKKSTRVPSAIYYWWWSERHVQVDSVPFALGRRLYQRQRTSNHIPKVN